MCVCVCVCAIFVSRFPSLFLSFSLSFFLSPNYSVYPSVVLFGWMENNSTLWWSVLSVFKGVQLYWLDSALWGSFDLPNVDQSIQAENQLIANSRSSSDVHWHKTSCEKTTRSRRFWFMSSSQGTGSQLVLVVCVGKYPGGQSWQWVLWGPATAVSYECSYWLSVVLCTPGPAVLRVCMYGDLGYGKAVFILLSNDLRIMFGFWRCWCHTFQQGGVLCCCKHSGVLCQSWKQEQSKNNKSNRHLTPLPKAAT